MPASVLVREEMVSECAMGYFVHRLLRSVMGGAQIGPETVGAPPAGGSGGCAKPMPSVRGKCHGAKTPRFADRSLRNMQ